MTVETHEFHGSSNLAAGSFDDETSELVLTFRSGADYSYEGVPQAVWAGLKAAPSAGKYFIDNIKDVYE